MNDYDTSGMFNVSNPNSYFGSMKQYSRLVPLNKEPGRNDSCPCGSGKKYKKCCLLNKPKPYADLEADFELGQRLIAEYEAEQKMARLRSNIITDLGLDFL